MFFFEKKNKCHSKKLEFLSACVVARKPRCIAAPRAILRPWQDSCPPYSASWKCRVTGTSRCFLRTNLVLCSWVPKAVPHWSPFIVSEILRSTELIMFPLVENWESIEINAHLCACNKIYMHSPQNSYFKLISQEHCCFQKYPLLVFIIYNFLLKLIKCHRTIQVMNGTICCLLSTRPKFHRNWHPGRRHGLYNGHIHADLELMSFGFFFIDLGSLREGRKLTIKPSLVRNRSR